MNSCCWIILLWLLCGNRGGGCSMCGGNGSNNGCGCGRDDYDNCGCNSNSGSNNNGCMSDYPSSGSGCGCEDSLIQPRAFAGFSGSETCGCEEKEN